MLIWFETNSQSIGNIPLPLVQCDLVSGMRFPSMNAQDLAD